MGDDSEDEQVLAVFNVGQNAGCQAVPVPRQSRQEQAAAMRRRRWGDGPRRDPAPQRSKARRLCAAALVELVPTEMPAACRMEAVAAGGATGSRFHCRGIAKAALGTSLKETLADSSTLGSACGAERNSVVRSQQVVAACIAHHQDAAAASRLAGLAAGSVAVVTKIWDEASIRMCIPISTLTSLLGQVASEFRVLDGVLPNGRKRRQPTFVGQIFQSEVFIAS